MQARRLRKSSSERGRQAASRCGQEQLHGEVHEGRLERRVAVHQFQPSDLLLPDHSDGPLFAWNLLALEVRFLEDELATRAER